MRRVVVSGVVLLALLTAAAPAAAQAFVAGPPGPYVVDLRVTTIALPDPGAFPPLPATTPVAGQGLGFEVGAHVYFGRLGPARLGVGAGVLQARGRKAPDGLQTTLRTIAPQVSLNFGTAAGWSYLSAGAGISTVTFAAGEGVTAERERDGIMTVNAGGGARWFLGNRVAFGFDLRLYRLAAADALPSSMLFAAAAGVSLR